MDTTIEINGAFFNPLTICAPDRASRTIATPTKRRGDKPLSVPSRRQAAVDAAATEVGAAVAPDSEASRRRTDAQMEAVGFSLALLFVIGLGALGAWATVLVVNSLIQAQSIPQSQSYVEPPLSLVQNASWFQR